MSFKAPSKAAEARKLLCEQDGQAFRGTKIEWSSVHGPGHPFGGGFETTHPNHALKAGTDNTGGKKGK